MNLKMIGSGAIWCKELSSCAIINDKILLDIPNGTCKTLKKMNIDVGNIEYVFITHLHGDHFLDIPFLLLEKSNDNCKNKNLTIIGNEFVKETVLKLFSLAFPTSCDYALKTLNLKFINCNKNLSIDSIDFSSLEVDHGNLKPAHSYLIKENGHKVLFSGDTCLCGSIIDNCKDSYYAVLDCSLIKGNSSHMGIDNIKFLLDKNPNLKIVATHLQDSTRNQLKLENIKNLIIAEDGLCINL